MSLQVKICGNTRVQDIETALTLGADFLGFIFYPPSPRSITLERFHSDLKPSSPKGKRVAVSVNPSIQELNGFAEADFDFFQIHFPLSTPTATIESWSNEVGRERLWLAPKIPPSESFPAGLVDYCNSIVWDTFSKDKFGGTGKTGLHRRVSRTRRRMLQTGRMEHLPHQRH